MIYDKTDEKLFESLLNKYQIGLEALKDLIFGCINLLPYKCHKIKLQCGGSCIGSPDWIKSKKTAINHINYGNKCLQYASTFTLNNKKYGENHKEYQTLSLL